MPSSYCIPYFIANLYFRVNNGDESALRANKAGIIGLICATLIYFLWSLDCRFGARQVLKNCRDNHAKIMIYLFGLVLWLSWISAGIIIGMAYDQVYELPSQLPGLQSPL